MIEDRILIREVLTVGPDGSSVRKTEARAVQLRWLGVKPTDDEWNTDWRLLPETTTASQIDDQLTKASTAAMGRTVFERDAQ